MARPIFRNEVIGSYNDSFDPQYDISAKEGKLTGATLKLLNPVATAGTPQNADNMNNLFDFDNLDSMKGNTRTITFGGNGSIYEEIRSADGNIVNAVRETTFPTSSSTKETTTIYSDDGVTVLRKTTITTSFGTQVTEVIS